MNIIYADTLFVLNAFVDYLLLLASGRLAGEPLHRGRMVLGAMLGGLYAVAVFLPGMSFLSHPLCKAGTAVLMVLIGLGSSRRFLRQILIFFSLACAFGGGILAIGLLDGEGAAMQRGVIDSTMDLNVVLLSAAGCYMLLTIVFRYTGRHSAARGEILPVQLWLQDRQVSLMALLDTGNTLTDPVSGRGVMVVDGESLQTLFPPGVGPEKTDLLEPAPALERLNRGDLRGRFFLLPYRAVGVECGILLAVRMDRVRVAGTERNGMLVALSPTPVSDGGGYRALLGSI